MSDVIISCQNSTIESGATVELEAKSTIMLDVGFTIDLGGEFAAEISGMEYCGSDLSELEMKEVQNVSGEKKDKPH